MEIVSVRKVLWGIAVKFEHALHFVMDKIATLLVPVKKKIQFLVILGPVSVNVKRVGMELIVFAHVQSTPMAWVVNRCAIVKMVLIVTL